MALRLPEVGTSPVALASLAPGQGRLLTMFAPMPCRLPVPSSSSPRRPGGADGLPAWARNGLGGAGSLAARPVGGDHRWQAWQEELLIDASQPYPAIVARHWGDPADR
jgi:general secretion pathway protein K